MVLRDAQGVSAHKFHTKWCQLFFATPVSTRGGDHVTGDSGVGSAGITVSTGLYTVASLQLRRWLSMFLQCWNSLRKGRLAKTLFVLHSVMLSI
jgi:hypothetical protein